MPTIKRWVFVFCGIFFELLFVIFFVKILGRGVGEIFFSIVISFFYWLAVLFCRNVKVLLAGIPVVLIPYNRFLILSTENAYLLGRISDYLLISLHLFEIPLYTFAFYFLIKNGPKFTLPKNLEIFVNPVPFFLCLLLVSTAQLLFKNNLLFGLSRLQLLIDFILLYICLCQLSLKQIFLIVFSSAVIQSIISIFQVGFNHSIGLSAIGESVFNESLFYIAKSFIFDQLLVRAYGTFPHPNLLSAFLFFSLLLSFYFLIKEMFDGCFMPFSWRNVGRVGVLSLFLLVVYLTQSRTVILSLFFSVLFFFVIFIFNNFSGRNRKMLLFITLFFISFFSFLVFRERILSLSTYDKSSFTNRLELQEIAVKSVQKFKFFGLGPNGYLKFLAENKGILTNFSFIVEPVHNVFLLIMSEYGIFIFLIFILFIFSNLAQSAKFTINTDYFLLTAPIIIFLFLSLNLDHYLLTLKQGIFIFALSFRILDVWKVEK